MCIYFYVNDNVLLLQCMWLYLGGISTFSIFCSLSISHIWAAAGIFKVLFFVFEFESLALMFVSILHINTALIIISPKSFFYFHVVVGLRCVFPNCKERHVCDQFGSYESWINVSRMRCILVMVFAQFLIVINVYICSKS